MIRETPNASGGAGGFSAREALWALGIFVVALLLRLVYLEQIAELPTHVSLISDARTYDEWAQRLAAGDWFGEEAFYQAPAYPYLLGLIYSGSGHDLEWTHRFMMGVGALSCVLLFATTRLLFGFSAGVAAGLLLAIYPVAIFFDGQIGKTGLALFLTLGLLYFLVRIQREPGFSRAVFAGIILGVLCLTRETALIFVPVIPVWMLWRFSCERGLNRRAIGLAATVVLGVGLVLVPVGLRNLWLGGSFQMTTAQMGPNFYIGNNPDATGLYTPLVPGRHTPTFESPDATRLAQQALGRELDRGEVSDYWLGRGLDFIVDQPFSWLRLMARKGMLTWNAVEIPDTEDVYVNADWSTLLRWLLPVYNFGVVASLGIVGLVLSWPRRKDTALFLLLLGVYTAGVAVFMVFGRMRFPLVPLLLPFAGYALVQIPRAWRELPSGPLAISIAAGLGMAVFANLPLVSTAQMQASAYTNLGGLMLLESRPDEAQEYLEKAESLFPDHPDLQYALATLRFSQDRLTAAEGHVRYMIRLSESDYRGHDLLSRILWREGEREESLRARVRARKLNPSGPTPQ